jgi:hypothetical protein
MLLPTVAAPIAGKTFRHLVIQSQELSPTVGWTVLIELPMFFMFAGACFLLWRQRKGQRADTFAAVGLTLSTLCYFRLNTLFFRGAWPWLEWTGRTPNQTIFSVFTLTLITAALVKGSTTRRNSLRPIKTST